MLFVKAHKGIADSASFVHETERSSPFYAANFWAMSIPV